jgi:hypothetical protein
MKRILIRLTSALKQVHEQLKTYLTEWRVLLHLKEAVTISSNVSKLLSKALHDPRHIANAPTVPDHHLKPQELPRRGLLPVTPLLGNPTSTTPSLQDSRDSPPAHAEVGTPINPALIASVTGLGPVIQHVLTPLSSQMTSSTAVTPTDRTTLDFLARQRVVTHIQKSKPAKKDRKRRTCPKCALIACPGSQKASNCQNKCRDCGESSCRGRNSKRLHKTCREGWDL